MFLKQFFHSREQASVGVEVSSNEIKTSQLDWMKNRCASIIFTCTNRDTSATDLFIHLALFLTSNWRVYEFRCQCIGRISRMLRKTLKVGIQEIVCFHLQKNTKNCLIPHQPAPSRKGEYPFLKSQFNLKALSRKARRFYPKNR